MFRYLSRWLYSGGHVRKDKRFHEEIYDWFSNLHDGLGLAINNMLS